MRLAAAGTLVLVLSSGTAHAQSPYVGATLVGDIVRASGSNDQSFGSGEAFGGALRVGTPLGNRWGVELEFARGGEIEGAPYSVLAASSVFVEVPPVGPGGIFPFPGPEISSRHQLTTVSPMVWWRQRIADRASLVYLGGLAFTRLRQSIEITYDPRVLALVAPQRIPFETTEYSAEATVGMEARVGMTEHLRLTAGVRMQTAAGGWLVRPGVGVLWDF